MLKKGNEVTLGTTTFEMLLANCLFDEENHRDMRYKNISAPAGQCDFAYFVNG